MLVHVEAHVNHGTSAAYKKGCRCPECTRVHSFDHQRYLHERSKGGMMLIDSRPVVAVGEYALKCRIPIYRTLSAVGLADNYFTALRSSGRKAHRVKAEQAVDAIAAEAAILRSALDDLDSAIEVYRRKTGKTRLRKVA